MTPGHLGAAPFGTSQAVSRKAPDLKMLQGGDDRHLAALCVASATAQGGSGDSTGRAEGMPSPAERRGLTSEAELGNKRGDYVHLSLT